MSSQATLSKLVDPLKRIGSHGDLVWEIGNDDVVHYLLASVISDTNQDTFFAEAKERAHQANQTNADTPGRNWVADALSRLIAALEDIQNATTSSDESAALAATSGHTLDKNLAAMVMSELKQCMSADPPTSVVNLRNALLFAFLASINADHTPKHPGLANNPAETVKTLAQHLLGHCLIRRQSLDPKDNSLYQTCRDVSMSELGTRFHMQSPDAATPGIAVDASIRQPPDLSQPRSWLSYLLCGSNEIKLSLNTLRTEQSARDFMRAFELEAAMEERTYLDYSHVYVNRMRRMVNTSQLERSRLEACITSARDLSKQLARIRQLRAKPQDPPFLDPLPNAPSTTELIACWADRSIQNLDRMVKLMERSRNMHGWMESTFADVSIEQDFSRLMRGPWHQVNLKFGTWIRRIWSGIATALFGVIVGSALTSMLSAKFLPTEKWFWTFVFLSLACGVWVYFGRRGRLRTLLGECKDRLYFLNPDRLVKGAKSSKRTIYDHLRMEQGSTFDRVVSADGVRRKWSDAWNTCEKSDSVAFALERRPRWKRNGSLVAIFLIILALPLIFFESRKFSYFTKNDSGELCLLESGVTIWPGPGHRVLLNDGNRPFLLSQAVIYLISPFDAHSIKRCTGSSSGFVSVSDGRRTQRSVLVPFPGDVRGCGSEDWQRQVQSQSNDAKPNGTQLSHSAAAILKNMQSAANACDGTIVLDVLGFASERGFQCNGKSASELNVELAEFRRAQVINALNGDTIEFEPEAAAPRWRKSIQRMQMQRLFPEGPDSLSRYVEIRIIDDGGCFGER